MDWLIISSNINMYIAFMAGLITVVNIVWKIAWRRTGRQVDCRHTRANGLTITFRTKGKKDMNVQERRHIDWHTHTFGGCAPDILQSTVGAGETVMDYRHIWAVISRSHIPPAFSRRQKSCIMVSHWRPGTPGCLVNTYACILSLLYLQLRAE